MNSVLRGSFRSVTKAVIKEDVNPGLNKAGLNEGALLCRRQTNTNEPYLRLSLTHKSMVPVSYSANNQTS